VHLSHVFSSSFCKYPQYFFTTSYSLRIPYIIPLINYHNHFIRWPTSKISFFIRHFCCFMLVCRKRLQIEILQVYFHFLWIPLLSAQTCSPCNGQVLLLWIFVLWPFTKEVEFLFSFKISLIFLEKNTYIFLSVCFLHMSGH
jgi:hypothetical protein